MIKRKFLMCGCLENNCTCKPQGKVFQALGKWHVEKVGQEMNYAPDPVTVLVYVKLLSAEYYMLQDHAFQFFAQGKLKRIGHKVFEAELITEEMREAFDAAEKIGGKKWSRA